MDMPLRCGCSEQLGDGTPALRLPTNRPLYFVRDALPDFTRDDIAAWAAEAFARWTAVADIEGRRILDMSQAGREDIVFLITVADLGRRGAIADMQLPSSGLRVQTMRINNRIAWRPTDGEMRGGTDPVRTVAHELGHGFGFQHWPEGDPLELMEPVISQTIITPQPTEAAMAVKWFGAPIGGGPTPPAGREPITIQCFGPPQIPGYRVTKLA